MMKLLLVVFSCLVSWIICPSVAINFDELKKEHAIISSPENITVFYVSASKIVIGWDLRPPYIPHDIRPKNMSMLTYGDVIEGKKPQVHLVAVKNSLVNQTSSDEKNETGSANDEMASAVPTETAASSGSDQKDGSDHVPENDNDSSSLVCHPVAYFANYTVAINQIPNAKDNKWAVLLKDLPGDIPLATLKIKHKYPAKIKMVKFEDGCLVRFQVLYKQRNGSPIVKTINIDPHHRVANIIGLKEWTTYEITVQAVYIKDEVLPAGQHYVSTKQAGDKPQCVCDWHGTVNLRNSCQVQFDGRLCQCRPEYQGLFCEECAAGYYRTAPYYPCNKCPCDEYSSKKSSCSFDQSFLTCDECEVGYVGKICHQCDSGFYRHGKHCVSCACNGNSDDKKGNMCEAETGKCLNCMRNTTGFHCERCLPGYLGDAVTARNCTLLSDLNGGQEPNASSFNSSPSPAIVAVIVVVLLLCIAVFAGFIMFKRLRARQQRRAFWTVEMRRDKTEDDFNSVQNDDAHLDDMDDLEFYEHHGGTTSASKYSRLNEQI